MNSSEFHDPQYKNSNFVLADLKRERWDAKEVTFGAYKLNESQVTSLSTNTETKVTLTDDKLRELDKQIVKIYKSKHGSKSNETDETRRPRTLTTPWNRSLLTPIMLNAFMFRATRYIWA